MSSDKLTRCPHCQATFKVSEAQLSVANGRVRCGACMNVFDALAYSLGDAPATQPIPPTIDSKAASSKASLTKTKAPASKKASTSYDEQRIQDDPIADAVEDGSEYARSPSVRLEDDFSASFKALDEPDSASPQFPSDADSPPLSTDESWAEQMLEDEHRTEPKISEAALDEPNTSKPSSSEASTQNDFIFADDSERNRFNDAGSSNQGMRFYDDNEQHPPRKRHWFASGAMALVNISLILVLLVLASWFHYEKLVQYPQIAAIYEKACELAGCTLPELSDVSKIKSHNLVVRSHPTSRNALIIDTVITNHADFPQDFPNLALYFSDLNNKTIAQKLIEPEQYLNEDVLAWGQMPSKEAIHISLEIVDPGKAAVNYTLRFFPAK